MEPGSKGPEFFLRRPVREQNTVKVRPFLLFFTYLSGICLQKYGFDAILLFRNIEFFLI